MHVVGTYGGPEGHAMCYMRNVLCEGLFHCVLRALEVYGCPSVKVLFQKAVGYYNYCYSFSKTLHRELLYLPILYS